MAFRGGHALPALIRKYEAKPIRVFTHVATRDMENSGGNWWFANQEFERALAFSGYDYQYRECEGGHGARYCEAFPEAMRWLWRDYPAPVLASPGPPRIQDILIPGEPWRAVRGAYKSAGNLTATAQGEVWFCDAAANQIHKIGSGGEAVELSRDAGQVCGLTGGADGGIYGVSAVRGQVLAFDWVGDGRPRVLAEGVPGVAIVAAPHGGFYIAGQEGGQGKVWHVDGQGGVRVVDAGLRSATGVAISIDGWVLYVADGASHFVHAYRINGDGTLANRERQAWLHVPDCADDSGAAALACTEPSNILFVATRMGVQTSDPEGHNQCIIPAPRGGISGLCFGGAAYDTLFASCGGQVFARKVKVKGHCAFHGVVKPAGFAL